MAVLSAAASGLGHVKWSFHHLHAFCEVLTEGMEEVDGMLDLLNQLPFSARHGSSISISLCSSNA